MLGELINILIL